MENFDFGVALAFWLTLFSTFICVVYGSLNWNRGVEKEMDKTVEHWAQEEDRIDEEL